MKRWLPPLLTFLIFVTLWHLAVRWRGWPPFLLPGPMDVASRAVECAPVLFQATMRTAAAAFCGFAASLVAGILIAAVFSQSALIRNSLFPYAIFLQTVPIVAIAPLIILWFDTGFQSVVIVSFIISLFPIVTNATAGMVQLDSPLLELFTLHRANRWQTLWKLRLPHAVPHIVTGARISSGLSVIGAIVGEFFAGHGADRHGLGYLIVVSSGQLKTAELFAAIFASTALGLVIFSSVGWFSRRVLARWPAA